MRQRLAFLNIWSSYATYYFGKVNLSIVVPALLVAYKDLSLYNVGLVSSGFFFAYAIGQFLHGQISERFNPFIYVSAGLLLSGIMNLLLGFCGGFFVMLLLIETFDGFFQAMGWSSIVRSNSLIQTKEKREASTTLLGCSYQVGNSVAWLVSAFAVGQWGWRAGFFMASGFLLLRGLSLLATKPKIEVAKPHKTKQQIKQTLSTPIVLSGISLCALNMIRYGVITWIPLYFFERGGFGVAQMGKVGLKVFLLPLAGVMGTLTYNALKVNRDKLSILFIMLLGCSLFVLPFTSGSWSLVLLLIGSFFLYGPHVFLVTTCPTRFVEEKIVAASTGFIDGMGYVGTVLIGILVPFILTQTSNNWNVVFFFWACLSFVVMATIVTAYVGYFKNKTQ
ncbi:MAG: MFS transporter [Candidatus Aminicenantes bacterium]|nr:MFS transporter [Candidatus Aminicenantes bacterium]